MAPESGGIDGATDWEHVAWILRVSVVVVRFRPGGPPISPRGVVLVRFFVFSGLGEEDRGK